MYNNYLINLKKLYHINDLTKLKKNNIHNFKMQKGGMYKFNLDKIYNSRVDTIENDGFARGIGDKVYRNQCIYISIRDFLKRNGYPDINLDQVRKDAGVEGKYENVFWEQDNVEHEEALVKLSNIYQLDIFIWNVNLDGYLDSRLINGLSNDITPRYRVGDGNANIINIASYGNHFELITGGSIFGDCNSNIESQICGKNYVPKSFNEITEKYEPIIIKSKEYKPIITKSEKEIQKEKIQEINDFIMNITPQETSDWCKQVFDVLIKLKNKKGSEKQIDRAIKLLIGKCGGPNFAKLIRSI